MKRMIDDYKISLHLKDEKMKMIDIVLTIEVPNDVNFIAVDSDGEIFGYNTKPRIHEPVYSPDDGYWYNNNGQDTSKLPPVNWRESLIDLSIKK